MTLAVMVLSESIFTWAPGIPLKPFSQYGHADRAGNRDCVAVLNGGGVFPQAVPDMARHVYFEATAMIIGLVTSGWLFGTEGAGTHL